MTSTPSELPPVTPEPVTGPVTEPLPTTHDPSVNTEPVSGEEEGEGRRRRATTLAQDIAGRMVARSARHDLSHHPKSLIREHDDNEEPYKLPGVSIPGIGRYELPATLPARFGRYPRINQIIEACSPRGSSEPKAHRLQHDLLIKVVREAGHHGAPANPNPRQASAAKANVPVHRQGRLSRLVNHAANRAARPGEQRDDILEDDLRMAQRVIYQRFTHLPVSAEGEIGGVPPAHERWIPVLSPHNIDDLKNVIVARWMQATKASPSRNKESIPRAHMASGNVMAIEPGIMAGYLGVTPEEWMGQMAGKEQVVPQYVLTALGHYMSISDENLSSVRDSIIDSGDVRPVHGAIDSEDVSLQTLRHELTGTSPNQQIRPSELQEIDKIIRSEIADTAAQLKKDRGIRLLPRDEFVRLEDEAREKVIREYLGTSVTDELVEQYLGAHGRWFASKHRG